MRAVSDQTSSRIQKNTHLSFRHIEDEGRGGLRSPSVSLLIQDFSLRYSFAKKCKKKSITKIKNLVETVENFFEDPSTKFPKEWNGFIKVINKDNISRKQCLVLPFNVLSKLIKNYE